MEAKNILAVRNDRFGEFLLNIPAFTALRQSFPQAKLTVVVDPYLEELAHCIESIDAVMPFSNKKHSFSEVLRFSRQIKAKKFDICIVFNPSREFHIISYLAGIPVRVGYNRKWPFLLSHKTQDNKYLGLKHEIEYNLDLLRLIGINPTDKTVSIKIDRDIIKRMRGYLGANYNIVALHPFTSDPIKQWPKGNFLRLAQKLIAELKVKVVIVGGKDEAGDSCAMFSNFGDHLINMTGRTTLVELAGVLKNCLLLVSGDSGPAHLASAVGVPVIAIFRDDLPGKSAIRWAPPGKDSVVIKKYNLVDISVEEVFDKVKLILEN